MILHKDQFPITIQAFEITGDLELFIAEQVVNSQAEVDTFSSKYAGKLIKAKAASIGAANTISGKKRKSPAITIFIVILIILIILAVFGFYTGWIQRTTGVTH